MIANLAFNYKTDIKDWNFPIKKKDQFDENCDLEEIDEDVEEDIQKKKIKLSMDEQSREYRKVWLKSLVCHWCRPRILF